MPIQLAPIPDNPLISGYIWTLKSEDHLACLVARVYLGHYLHVEKILAKLNPKAPSFGGAAAKEAKAKLVVKAGEDPWHRDGLLFQAISWVAAHQAADPTSSVFSLPHQIPAHKGFDGLQIQLDNQRKLSGLVISEDKATDNHRKTITQDVWPEIRLLTAGKRQTELMQETTALLQRAHVADPDQVIEGIVWKRIRSFRVSITGGPDHNADPGLSKLFKGYDLAAPGKDAAKRRAEVVCFPDLRPWMSQFAAKVRKAIDTEKSRANV